MDGVVRHESVRHYLALNILDGVRTLRPLGSNTQNWDLQGNDTITAPLHY